MKKLFLILCLVLMGWNVPTAASNDNEVRIEKIYYPSGALREEVSYKNGRKDGIGKYYYENGALGSETSYKNDERDGIWKEYYESGALKAETSYKDGKQDGIEKLYDESGVLEWEILYKNGKEEKIIKGKEDLMQINIDYNKINKMVENGGGIFKNCHLFKENIIQEIRNLPSVESAHVEEDCRTVVVRFRKGGTALWTDPIPGTF